VAGRCNASQDAQDAWDAGDASLASGRNADGSEAGSVFANDVANSHICQRSRTTRHAPFGILRPLSILYRSWQDISMDFVTGLPWSNGHDAIWVVVDRLTKMGHLVPCRTTIDAPSLAALFLDNIWKHYGLPLTIISDRGPQFGAEFWGTVCCRLK